jgi:cellulose synthase (UDP-forming)
MIHANPRTLALDAVRTLQESTASRVGWTAVRTSEIMSGLRWGAWITCAALAFAFLWQPVGVGAQLALGVAVIVAMTLIRSAGSGRFMRWTFLALGSFIILRYVYWRATQTLPDIDDAVGFTFGTLLALAELYCAFVLAVSLTINADPLERGDAPCAPDSQLPDVDVFIPSYDEDPSILAMTIAAARSMDYPPEKLKVWLLDDGATDQKCADPDEVKARQSQSRRSALRKLCADLGANYLTRARNEHAKAGNLNNGLAHSVAPIVVVFDADHVPFRSFLRETIGYFFTDPKLFLVQTPHVFLNRDPIERNLRTFDHMPSENEMFYSVTQRGLDKWNGSFFCGSAALLRRAALESTNGFSGITVTEDCETAFELHRAGWTSVYVDRPLTAGLQPETFESFIGQRSRWCQGMFQLLLLKNPALKTGLTPIQRLAYLSSMTFWFFPLPRLIFMFAPLLHIFFDVKLFISTVEESIAYAATYVVVNTMIQNELFGHVRWPWMSELYEYVQGVYLVKAIGSVVASPRKPTFNVTAKGVSLESDHLSELAWPFIAIFIVLLLGVATAAWRYAFEPGVTNVMLVVGLWALFNLLIAAAALGVVAERRELRRHPRLAVARRSSVCFDGHTADATIVNVSAGGCAIRVAAADFIESPLQVGQSHGRLAILGADGRVVMRTLDVIRTRAERDGEAVIIGLKFSLVPADYLVLADLIYGDADALMKFLTKRRKHMGILRGTMLFLRWSACEPFRAFYYLFAGYRQSMVARTGAAAPAAKAAMRPARPVALISAPADPAVEDFAAPLVAAPSISPEASAIDPDVIINRRGGVVTPSMLSFDRANALYVPRT